MNIKEFISMTSTQAENIGLINKIMEEEWNRFFVDI
jgi:hypothetical protein